MSKTRQRYLSAVEKGYADAKMGVVNKPLDKLLHGAYKKGRRKFRTEVQELYQKMQRDMKAKEEKPKEPPPPVEGYDEI